MNQTLPENLDALVKERVAASFYDCSISKLQKDRMTGRGPAFVRLSTKAIRYRVRDLIEFAQERLKHSTSEA